MAAPDDESDDAGGEQIRAEEDRPQPEGNGQDGEADQPADHQQAGDEQQDRIHAKG